MATDPVTRAQIADLRERVEDAETAIAAGVTAGAGLTKTGVTIDVVANADGSIVVAANDVKVGVINATQHGTLAGGTTHADAVAAGASGFMTGADKTKLDAILGTNTGDQFVSAGIFGTHPPAAAGLFCAATVVELLAASASHPGAMSAADFSKLAATTNTNSGDVTLAAVGAVANANGATLTGQALNLQPASASFPGVMTAAQFTTLAANTADVTIGTFGAVPTAKGISISGQAITLQPADASNPGAVTTGAQSIAGAKTLSGVLTLDFSDSAHMAFLRNSDANGISGFAFKDSGGTARAGTGYVNSGFGGMFGGKGFFSLGTGISFIIGRGAATTLFEIDGSSNTTMPAGTLSVGGVLALTQTNTVASITNKSFTSPTLASPTISGTAVMSGGPTVTGGPQCSGNWAFSGGTTHTSNFRYATRSTTATTVTVGTADHIILVDATTGATAVNLQSVATAGGGREIQVMKIDNSVNAVTVNRSGSDTINGLAAWAGTAVVLAVQGDCCILQAGATASTAWYRTV